MKILGIDPGLAIVGYGLIEDESLELLASGHIQTDKDLEYSKRLVEISKDLEKIIRLYKPDVVVCEELFFYKNITTGISVAQARGVILLTIAKHRLPLYEYTPLEIKKAITTYGMAKKEQVQDMVKNILKLSHVPKPDDTADAIAVAICHAYSN